MWLLYTFKYPFKLSDNFLASSIIPNFTKFISITALLGRRILTLSRGQGKPTAGPRSGSGRVPRQSRGTSGCATPRHRHEPDRTRRISPRVCSEAMRARQGGAQRAEGACRTRRALASTASSSIRQRIAAGCAEMITLASGAEMSYKFPKGL